MTNHSPLIVVSDKKKCKKSLSSDFHPEGLSAVSSKHEIWNLAKTDAVTIEETYRQAEDLKRYSERVKECAEFLLLKQVSAKDELSYRANAHQCKVRHCPICQRVRAYKLRKRFERVFEVITEKHPNHRWVFVTFTIRNPQIVDLRTTLREMSKAWERMLKLRNFPKVEGWIRSTEVTMGNEGAEFCHPHFHCLFLVPPSYFSGKGYKTHADWVNLWQAAARLDYKPTVNVKAIKDRKCGIDREVIKVAGYSVKAEEIAENPEWFAEFHRQTHHLRFHATGGLIKQVMPKEDEKLTGEGLAEDENEGEETGRSVLFGFHRDVEKYRRKI
jgi:plasmid rolling circle replication initiator protein Rep